MASSAIQDSAPGERETFKNYFECWLVEQNQLLRELVAASKQHHSSAADHDQNLRSLVNRVMEHYEHYYNAKAKWGKLDVLAMLSPSWISRFEDALLWIGGWRPSMAFQLLHSKSGLQLEDQLYQLIRGLGRGDLGDLSPCQVRRIDELQRKTIREEKEITEKMAKQQETAADSSMVELTHLVSEMMRKRSSSISSREFGEASADDALVLDDHKEIVESAMESKEEGLQEILQRADHLRLTTLKAVIDILTPTQAVHFLIAAAELHLRIHEWGKQRDNIKASSA